MSPRHVRGKAMSRTMSWVTYEELAMSRQIAPRAAVRLTQRHKWQRRPTRDDRRRVRVLVPAEHLGPRSSRSLATALEAVRNEVAALRREIAEIAARQP